jgi:hypothetical protein
LAKAYKKTLHDLSLVDRHDPLSLLVAQAVIEIGKTGVRDPVEISKLVIKALNIY